MLPLYMKKGQGLSVRKAAIMWKREHSTRALKQVGKWTLPHRLKASLYCEKKKKSPQQQYSVCYNNLPSTPIFCSSTCEKITLSSNKLAAYFRAA
jgi:hypothetical protein